jgi:hypothetical protein
VQPSPGCTTAAARYAKRAAIQMCTTSAGSELSRQVPVDLKPDADLNEGRGCPGHWSSSLAFSSGNKVRSWRAATQAPATTREDAHLLSKKILLQTAP